MSISSAMRAGVSGLLANSSALAAISDNIANVNTTAYKRHQVNFGNIVTSQYLEGRYSAGGVQGLNRQFISQQGLIQAAAQSTDMAISGEGFFVVTDKGAGLTDSDQRVFTRAGSFAVDEDGYLVNDTGYYLQGWPIAADGTIDRSPSDVTRMSPINVRNLGAAVSATDEVILAANLNKDQAPNAAAFVAGSMAQYAADPTTGVKPDFTIEMNVVDSAGGSHRIQIGVRRGTAAQVNTWNADIYAVPTTDVTGGAQPGLIKSGQLIFNPDGTINLNASTLFGPATIPPAAPSPTTIALGESNAGANPKWATALGIEGSSIDIDLTKLTQYASPSAVNSVNPNGASPGNIVGVTVDENGIVSATFDNTEVRRIAQVAIATFPNPDGLSGVNGGAYRPTLASGEFVIKEPGVAGAGKIAPQALEASTVDLSAEFTGLITTQRAYSASSKIITTADQMLEELINIKR
ncbi:MAG TPA: flagellar hook protein FlgE [Phenylobacterium sp.]